MRAFRAAVVWPTAFILILVALIVQWLWTTEDADAWSHTGFKFNHLTITYWPCDNEELAQSVKNWADVSALKDGGCSETHPDIRLEVLDPWPFGNAAGIGGAGYVGVPTHYEHSLGVIQHEVGHAAGMGHSSENFAEMNLTLRSAAMFAYCCNPLNEDDIAGVVALYGPAEISPTPPTLFRVVVGGLAYD